jgi:hypothetical protein
MSTNGHNMATLPKINVSLSDRERARLTRLAELRGSKPSRVLADAVTHMLATLELNESVHYVVPSEQAERER